MGSFFTIEFFCEKLFVKENPKFNVLPFTYLALTEKTCSQDKQIEN